MGESGWELSRWLQTTASDAGTEVAARALDDEPDLIMVCGGDGTVNAVATALAHTDVPLGIVPTGTGNLLGRNLGIPPVARDAIDVALNGAAQRVDMGWLGEHRFVGMAGMGLDAVMVRDASYRLKKRLGWPAYVPAAVKGLLSGSRELRFRCDGGPWTRRRVVGVVVGNMGQLQGGVPLLPAADPTDGLLDLALLGGEGLTGWLRMLRGIVAGGEGRGAVEPSQFRRLELRSRKPRPFEVDGDLRGEARSLTIEVDPGALVVKVPR